MVERSPAIVVVGSANLDMIVRSDRLPQPGETVVGGEFLTAGGGKGANQAIAASRLGARVALIARVGDDETGHSVLQSYRDEGLDLTAVTVDPEAKTGVALILVDKNGQNMIAVASGANSRLTSDDVRVAEPAIRSAKVLMVQSEVPLETVRTALRSARQYGVITVLNPAPAREADNSVLEFVDWLIPNEFEATTLTGLVVDDLESATLAGQLLVEFGTQNVVITLGRSGAVHVTKGATHWVEPFPVSTVDTTAAGDAFTAGLAVSLARGRSIEEALVYASATGALATTRRGAQPSLPSQNEVDELVMIRASPARSS